MQAMQAGPTKEEVMQAGATKEEVMQAVRITHYIFSNASPGPDRKNS
jgi:hypothetical protein